MAGLSLSTTREENFTSKDIFRTETKIWIADPKDVSISDSGLLILEIFVFQKIFV